MEGETEGETEGRFVPLKKAIMSMVASLEEARDSSNITARLKWLEDFSVDNFDDPTTDIVTPAMIHELFAVIDLSIARLEREQEELTEEHIAQEVAFKEKIAEAAIKERVLSDLKDELQTRSKEVQKQKELIS